MRTKLGMGLVMAGLLALANTANAEPVDYSGLAFNNQDYTNYGAREFWFTSIYDDSWNPDAQLDDSGGVGNLGQANYTLNFAGTGAPSANNLIGGTLDFKPSGQVIVFDSGDTMEITGGQFYIESDNGSDDPTVTLPFGLGTANPDYQLTRGPDKTSGYLDVVWNGVAEMRLYICEDFSSSGDICSAYGDDRPFSEGQPYNTMNVGNEHSDEIGNGDGDDDLSMFVLMAGTCTGGDITECPFYSEWQEWEVTGTSVTGYYCPYYSCDAYSSQWVQLPSDYDGSCSAGTKYNGKYIYSKPKAKYEYKGCKIEEDKEKVTKSDATMLMKLALWGTGGPGDTEVPEPATLSLLGLGLVGLGAAARRRRKAA